MYKLKNVMHEKTNGSFEPKAIDFGSNLRPLQVSCGFKENIQNFKFIKLGLYKNGV